MRGASRERKWTGRYAGKSGAPFGRTKHGNLRDCRATPHGDGGRPARPRIAARRRSSCRRIGNANGNASRPGRRPVSGLASLGRPPSRRRASFEASRQWRVGRPALAYRCGGSCGLARVESARHRIPVSPATRDSRRTPA
jgi:hypothetical protein